MEPEKTRGRKDIGSPSGAAKVTGTAKVTGAAKVTGTAKATRGKEDYSSTITRSLASYDVPYPSKHDKNIQTLVYAKKEFRECVSGSKISEDKVVELGFFNTQVFFQRYVVAFGSVCLFWMPSSGKTGAFIKYQRYMTTQRPGEVSEFFFVAGDTQINDFQRQATYDFGGVKRSAHSKGNIQETSERTKVRQFMKAQNIQTYTYQKMAYLILEMTNAEIIARFSSAVVFIDEAHFIKLTEAKDTKEEARQRKIIYGQFWRVGQLCPSCVFVLSTGTPITNDKTELLYLANLIPDNAQIKTPLSKSIADDLGIRVTNWVKVDLDSDNAGEQLEKVLRGTVLFCEAPSTGAVRSYLTDETIANLNGRFDLYKDKKDRPVSPSWRTVVFDKQLGLHITKLTMSPFQSRGYLATISDLEGGVGNRKHAVYSRSIQACVFAFPTEKYATVAVEKGLKAAEKLPDKHRIPNIDKTKFESVSITASEELMKDYTSAINIGRQTVKIVKSFKPLDWFEEYLKDDQLLYNSGVKVYDIVMHAMDPTIGPLYVASKYHKTTLLIIAWALLARDFEEYIPIRGDLTKLPPPKPRFAILHGKNKDHHQDILELMKHEKNVNGAYLRVIMGSPVSSTGINIGNIGFNFMLEPRFNMADFTQADNRSMRPNSHTNSLVWIKRKYGLDYFPVYSNYCVAEINPSLLREGEDMPTTDWKIYKYVVDKDKDTATVMRVLKQIAVDAQVNAGRNMPKNFKDYSAEANYRKVVYKPYNIDTSVPIDYTTYDSYYTNVYNQTLDESIIDTMVELVSAPLSYVLSVHEKHYSNIETLHSIYSLISKQVHITRDRLGTPLYLKEDKGTLYISRDISSGSHASDKSSVFYTNIVTLHDRISLNDIAVDYVTEESMNDLKHEIATDKTRSMYITTISSAPKSCKSALFEEVVSNYIVNTPQGAGATRQDVRSEAANWPSWARRMYNTSKHLYGTLLIGDNTSVVAHFHRIQTLFDSGTSYDAINSFMHAKTGIRVMYQRPLAVCDTQDTAHGEWRKANPSEFTTFLKILNNNIQPIISKMFKDNKDLGFIGIIVKYTTIHIRHFEEKETDVFVEKSSSDIMNIKKHNILPMLYLISGPTQDEKVPEGKLSKNEKGQLAKTVIKMIGEKNLNIDEYKKLSDDELSFYKTVLEEAAPKGAPSLASRLAVALYERDAIYAITGDIATVVTNIKGT